MTCFNWDQVLFAASMSFLLQITVIKFVMLRTSFLKKYFASSLQPLQLLSWPGIFFSPVLSMGVFALLLYVDLLRKLVP